MFCVRQSREQRHMISRNPSGLAGFSLLLALVAAILVSAGAARAAGTGSSASSTAQSAQTAAQGAGQTQTPRLLLVPSPVPGLSGTEAAGPTGQDGASIARADPAGRFTPPAADGRILR